MRAFIAIPVTRDVQEYATTVRQQLDVVKPDIKWVETINYHLTLKFLGEVKPQDITGIKQSLQMVSKSCPPFKLYNSGLGFYPNKRRPRVIWIGIEGELHKANYLGGRVDAQLHNMGFDIEGNRSFHLTLGRVRSERNLEVLMEKVTMMEQSIKKIPFDVNAFHLMESQIKANGPMYKLMERYGLHG